MTTKYNVAAPLEWAWVYDIQRQVLEFRIGRMTLVLSAPVAPNPEWGWEIYYDSHQILDGWGTTRQEAEARAIDRAREWVATATSDLAAIAQAFDRAREWVATATSDLAAIAQALERLEGLGGLEGLEPGEPGDPCPNDCGETLLAGSPSGNGRVACDKCHTYWD